MKSKFILSLFLMMTVFVAVSQPPLPNYGESTEQLIDSEELKLILQANEERKALKQELKLMKQRVGNLELQVEASSEQLISCDEQLTELSSVAHERSERLQIALSAQSRTEKVLNETSKDLDKAYRKVNRLKNWRTFSSITGGLLASACTYLVLR